MLTHISNKGRSRLFFSLFALLAIVLVRQDSDRGGAQAATVVPTTRVVNNPDSLYYRGSNVIAASISDLVNPKATVREAPVLREPVRAERRSTVQQAAIDLEIENGVLWLARCIFSESNRASEYELVAWAIRNRVDNRFGGRRTYQSVCLARQQFSAFNTARGRARYGSLSWEQTYRSGGLTARQRVLWRAALRTSLKVITAPAADRPFSRRTMWYYSEVSMLPHYTTNCKNKTHSAQEIRDLGRRHPQWAHEGRIVATGPDAARFRFMAK